jgi:hypothetical protein
MCCPIFITVFVAAITRVIVVGYTEGGKHVILGYIDTSDAASEGSAAQDSSGVI